MASGLILLLPVAILGLAAVRYRSELLGLGAAAQFLGGLLFIRYREAWRPPASGSVILLYMMAVAFLWFVTRDTPDGFGRLSRGLMIIATVALFIGHDLARTGLGPRRRANNLTYAILDRTEWPATLQAIADLPEVRSLKSATRYDPTPLFALLDSPRAEIRTVAFLVFEGREAWRPEEAETVLSHLQATTEPIVRVAGLQALSTVNEVMVLQFIATYLSDPSVEVRQKAAEILLARGSNWPIVRDGFRDALIAPILVGEGAMPGTAGRLPAMAICDLVAWATEPEPLTTRAVRTLVNHYAVLLKSGQYPSLGAELADQVVDPHSPATLRLEVATLLKGLGYLTPGILDRMTNSDQPGPVRLLAAELLLTQNPADEDAIDVLRGLGRQSHRETVLTIARLAQTYLKVDMGMPEGKVSPNSKIAIEAARRVLQWATGRAVLDPSKAGGPPKRVAPPPSSSPSNMKETILPSARTNKKSPWEQ